MNMTDKIKRLFFYRQHPDAALRYLPIVRLLKKQKLANAKILEVGSGSYGITPYLKKPIIGVDLKFDEPKYDLLTQVHGTGDKLPFKRNEFEVVILSDVLEHMPKNARSKVLDECIRVARKIVIISGPFGPQAFEQDKKLAQISDHHFLQEHLRYGLPEVSDILNYKNPKIVTIDIVGEYLNLRVREWLMLNFIKHYHFYLKGLMFLVPILKWLNHKPCYRTVIMIKTKV